jgi:hypothetical protein
VFISLTANIKSFNIVANYFEKGKVAPSIFNKKCPKTLFFVPLSIHFDKNSDYRLKFQSFATSRRTSKYPAPSTESTANKGILSTSTPPRIT